MKHTFSRLFVALIACFVCISLEARELNPFAFKLSEKLDGDVFYVTYYLNAPANSVKVVIEISGKEVVYDCTNAKNTAGTTKAKGIYTVPISLRKELNNNATNYFRDKTNLPWRVEVIGGNTAAIPTSGSITDALVKEYTFYAPGGIDIDTDPKSQNFGLIYCTETRTLKPELTADGTYYSQHYASSKWHTTPGLYVFDPAFQNMPPSDANYDFVTPNNARTFARAYNLGFSTTFNTTTGTGEQTYFYPKNTTYRTMAPRRVRISDDGRIFVTTWTTNGIYLKELNPLRLSYNYRNANGTLNNSGWITTTFQGVLDGTDNDHEFSSTLSHLTYNLETSDNKFIAAPNIALDVRGTGSNLTLFLAGGDKGSAVNFFRPSFYFNEYKLGTKTTWNTVPTKSDIYIKKRKVGSATTETTYTNCMGFRSWSEDKGDANGDGQYDGSPMSMVASYDAVNFEYDQYGGIWMCQYRENQNENASLYHINPSRKVDYEEYITDRSRGAIRYTKDWKKLVVAGGKVSKKTFDYNIIKSKKYNLHDYTISGDNVTLPNAELFYATLYNVTHTSSTAAPVLKNPVYIYLNLKPDDFAWDYAGNLYAVSVATEKVAAYALPNGGNPVVTPCRDTSYIENTYYDKLTVNIVPSNIPVGSATDNEFPNQMDRHNESYAGFNFYYRITAKFQLLGQPAPGYRFFQWDNNGEIENAVSTPSTMVSGGVTRTAKFAIDIREDVAVATRDVEATFPGAFVRRALDNQSYSTICLPFHLKSLAGTAYEGATVLRFAGTTPSDVEGENKLFLNFEKVTFLGNDYMYAGVPYLIKVKNTIAEGLAGEKIFTEAQCPVITEGTEYTHHDNKLSCTGNQYGGKSVTHNGVTFHGFINPTTFNASETNLFVTADNRLTTLYDQAKINGLRAYFSVSSPLLLAEIELDLPDETTTGLPSVTTQEATTKYLWNGKVHIQKNGVTYDLSGARVK